MYGDDVAATHVANVVDTLLDELSLSIADESSSSECLMWRQSKDSQNQFHLSTEDRDDSFATASYIPSTWSRLLSLPDPKEELETNSLGASSSNGRSSADSNLTRATESEKYSQANEYGKDDDARATYLTSSSKYFLLRVLCLRFLSITWYFVRVSLWK